MKLSEHIDIKELVPPDTYALMMDKCVDLIDPRIPVILEKIRELCGDKPMIINTWFKGGSFKYRGFRPLHCEVGAKASMHKKGKAVDFDIVGMTADEVRKVIRANAKELYALGLRRIEIGVSWVHIDLKETGEKTIKEFRP